MPSSPKAVNHGLDAQNSNFSLNFSAAYPALIFLVATMTRL
jgi:hypothetical protein